MKKHTGLKLFKCIDGNEIYIYTPKFGKWYYCNLEPMRVIRWIRLMIEYLSGGYLVFYLKRDGIFCSSYLAAEGGRRLKCTTKRDIVIGPSFTLPEHRRKGFNKLLRKVIVDYYSNTHDALYNYIEMNNKASIEATEKFGFIPVGRLKVKGFTRELVECSDGDHIIYKYDLKKK